MRFNYTETKYEGKFASRKILPDPYKKDFEKISEIDVELSNKFLGRDNIINNYDDYDGANAFVDDSDDPTVWYSSQVDVYIYVCICAPFLSCPALLMSSFSI
uniref:Uncharacterized protein n=1 Tax=Glossina brevipalpis TaxID=37001 RepID=A0A1A9WXB2_9MUSC